MLIGKMNHPAREVLNEIEWIASMGFEFIDLTLEPPLASVHNIDVSTVRQAIEDAGLQVIDVSNPSNCFWVGGYDTGGQALGVAVSGNYAYVANDNAGLPVIDVSNPANPQRVGGYDTSGSAFGVAVSGNYAYVADSVAGLQVIGKVQPK